MRSEPRRRSRPRRSHPRWALPTAGLAVLAGLGVAAATLAPADQPSGTELQGSGATAETAAAECGEGSFDAEAELDGSTWTVRSGDDVVHEGDDMLTAMREAVDSLDDGRTSQESVVVRGSGSVPGDESLDLPSHTSLEVCGTIDVTGEVSADHAAVRIRHAEDVTVPHLSLTGSPYFGVFVQSAESVHFGQVDLRMSGGHGMRIDSRDNDDGRQARDISIDDVYVSGTDNHGVETYSVDGFTVGTVTARDTAYSGLLLNDTENADVGLVDAENAGADTGYAAFRMANRNGMVGDAHPTNIRVGEVRARGGGRGIFCVSESGGAVIENVDIAGTGGNAVLIENCHNVTIAEEGGTVEGPGDIRIAARDEFANTSDVTLENLTVVDSAVNEEPCAEGTVVRDITWQDSQDNSC
ncbi:right-handed parallel beta-helix repeat-containing protein [Nocardiopsis oceani]